MLRPHDLPFSQSLAMQTRAFGADLAFLDDRTPGAADLRRAHALRGKKGQSLCLFEPGLGLLAVSMQARGDLPGLTRALAELSSPVRVLLCPEESAARLIKSLEAAQGNSFRFQRRKKLLFLEPPSPRLLTSDLFTSGAETGLAPGRMRRAAAADADAMAGMIDKQDGEMLDPVILAQGLAASGRAYLWESAEGKCVAVAALGCEDENSVDINTVNTRPDARGQGFARSLLQTLLAEQVFPKAASVLVEENNAPAEALYKKLGFRFACVWRYAEAGAVTD